MTELHDRRRPVAFGPFVVDPIRRLLFRDGSLVSITPRAFETLLVLMDGRGRVIDKDELMQTLWPDTIVEEINLNVQISSLRKVLGEQPHDHRYVVTVPRRGYAFVADVSPVDDESADVIPNGREASVAVYDVPKQAVHSERVPPPHARRYARGVVAATAALLMAVVGLPYLWRSALSANSESVRASIAILPFRALDDVEGASIAVGLTDALITQLGSVDDVRVVPTTSVLAYSAASTDPVAAGRALHVRTVLDGKIQIHEKRMRVTVQLLDVRDASTIWSETFDEDRADVFEIQDAIAGRIARSLSIRLTSIDPTPDTVGLRNPEAYALYLRGRYHWNRRTDQDIRISIEYYRRAVAVDESCALAYSGLADSYALLSVYGGLPVDEAYAKAREAADHALTLDENLAEAHTSRAAVLMRYDRNYDAARKEFERAIDLDPNDATAYHWYGEMLVMTGETDEAIDRLQTAARIDPLSLIVQSDLAWAHYYGRRYDEAASQCRRTLWLDSSFRPARQCLALVLVAQGHYSEALAECARADLSNSAIAGVALAGLGRTSQARTILQHLRWRFRQGNQSAYAAARVFVSLDEPDSAIRWLRHAVRTREGQSAYLAVDPAFDALRDDPGFRELIVDAVKRSSDG